MRSEVTPAACRLIVGSGNALAALNISYAAVLAVGLLTLPSPDQQIRNPCFGVMEVMILAMAPAMVAFTVGLHALAGAERKPVALLGVVFMSMCAALTCAVHFTVSTLGRQPEMASADWAPLAFSFTWPSVAYALDILAWDGFFPLGALAMAVPIQGAGRNRLARRLLIGSAVLSALGLAGVPLADMNVRNSGIIGYVLLFPIAAVLSASAVSGSGGRRSA